MDFNRTGQSATGIDYKYKVILQVSQVVMLEEINETAAGLAQTLAQQIGKMP